MNAVFGSGGLLSLLHYICGYGGILLCGVTWDSNAGPIYWSYSVPFPGLQAVYNNIIENVSLTLQVPGASLTTVSCYPSTQLVGKPADYVAYVTGAGDPSGNVSWTLKTPQGTLSPVSCSLNEGFSNPGPQPFGTGTTSCSVIVRSDTTGTFTGKGTFTETASYSGDAYNSPSVGKGNVTYTQLHAHFKISCAGSASGGILNATCTAELNPTFAGFAVKGGTLPAGTVLWTEVHPIGAFSPTTCTLVNVSGTSECSVRFYQGNASAPVNIVAVYSGDVYFPPKITTESLIQSSSGAWCTDQTQITGIKACGKSPADPLVSVASTDYLSQPNDTGTAPFPSTEYIDVSVGGVTNGTATICYDGPEVNSTASMDYYYNREWDPTGNGIRQGMGSGIERERDSWCQRLRVSPDTGALWHPHRHRRDEQPGFDHHDKHLFNPRNYHNPCLSIF